MKTAGFLFLGLILFFFYSDIAIEAKSVDCRGYPRNICPLDLRPHCGTDGITYSNKCYFCNAYVQYRGRLQLKHKGSCKNLPGAQG